MVCNFPIVSTSATGLNLHIALSCSSTLALLCSSFLLFQTCHPTGKYIKIRSNQPKRFRKSLKLTRYTSPCPLPYGYVGTTQRGDSLTC